MFYSNKLQMRVKPTSAGCVWIVHFKTYMILSILTISRLMSNQIVIDIWKISNYCLETCYKYSVSTICIICIHDHNENSFDKTTSENDGLCHCSGSELLASHSGIPGSVPVQSLSDFRRKKWHCVSSLLSTSVFPLLTFHQFL